MLSIKTLKDGSVAYVFGKELTEHAKKLYPYVAKSVLSNDDPSSMAVEPPKGKQKTLEDVRKNIESSSTTLRLNRPTKVNFTMDDLERQRKEIRRLVAELCGKQGLRWGEGWNKAYRLLLVKEGYDVEKEGPCRLRKRDGNTLINRILKDGKGTLLIKLLSDILDK